MAEPPKLLPVLAPNPKSSELSVGFNPDAVLGDREPIFTGDTIADDNAAGMAINMWSDGALESADSTIISVDENGGDAHPNANGVTCSHIAWGLPWSSTTTHKRTGCSLIT